MCLDEEESPLAIGGSRFSKDEWMNVVRVDIEYFDARIVCHDVEWELLNVESWKWFEVASRVIMCSIDIAFVDLDDFPILQVNDVIMGTHENSIGSIFVCRPDLLSFEKNRLFFWILKKHVSFEEILVW